MKIGGFPSVIYKGKSEPLPREDNVFPYIKNVCALE